MKYKSRRLRRYYQWPSIGFIRKKFWRLITHPIFLLLTIVGNLSMAVGAGALYFVEVGTNPQIETFMDSLWWAVSTVTTVGYGDVVPTTTPGRIIGMLLMILGTALFCSYTALFADALISEELDELEADIIERVPAHKPRKQNK